MIIPALALLLAAAPAADTPSAGKATKFNTLIVFGEDACPQSNQDEIVVCARLPENERYRLPKRLREKRRTEGPASVAWGRKVETLEYVGRMGIPNSCSTNGSGGQTGCFQQFMRQARAEREAAAQEAADIP